MAPLAKTSLSDKLLGTLRADRWHATGGQGTPPDLTYLRDDCVEEIVAEFYEGEPGALHNGKSLVSFSGYNYLGLNGHPAVTAAAKNAIDKYGTSASASRIVAGQIELHGELERKLANFLGTDDALIFISGGAYFLESLTDEIAARALELIDRVEELGGAVAAIEQGFVQHEIEESAFRYAQEVESGERILSSALHRPPIHEPAGLADEKFERDILCNRKMRDQVEMLVDRYYPKIFSDLRPVLSVNKLVSKRD